MNSELLEKKLGCIENLPSLPIVLRQLQKVIHSPNSSMNQIAAIVAKDPALASRTIRLVNSAFYGLGQKVTSVSQAIVIIGLNTLNTLMIGLTVMKFFKNTMLFGFDQQKFWEHCFGTALLSRQLAEENGFKNNDEFFVMGLLHDMGRLVLDQFLHDEFLEIIMRTRGTSRMLIDCEKEVLGFDHSDAGEWLAIKWGLPEPIVVSMGYHHRENSLPEQYAILRDTLHVICNANDLCSFAKIGSSGELPDNSKNLDISLFNGISSQRIQEIVQTVKTDLNSTIEEWNKAL